MTVIRLTGGGVAIHSPTRINAELVAAIECVGSHLAIAAR
jgi:hypothetical protein